MSPQKKLFVFSLFPICGNIVLYILFLWGDFMKEQYIKLRVNAVEKSLLKSNADLLDMTLSDYIRFCCLLFPPKILKRRTNGIDEIVIICNKDD